jgi:hypothetical protein
MQNLIRSEVEQLAKMVELKVSEAGPDKCFLDDFDKEEFVKNSLKKHQKQEK